MEIPKSYTREQLAEMMGIWHTERTNYLDNELHRFLAHIRNQAAESDPAVRFREMDDRDRNTFQLLAEKVPAAPFGLERAMAIEGVRNFLVSRGFRQDFIDFAYPAEPLDMPAAARESRKDLSSSIDTEPPKRGPSKPFSNKWSNSG